MDTCGGGHFLIRKEKVADSKISGYVWTGSEANCFFQISLYSRAYVRITFKKGIPLGTSNEPYTENKTYKIFRSL